MADTKLTGLSEISVPALADLGYFVDVSDSTDDPAGSSRCLSLGRLLGMLRPPPGGRLSLASNTPIALTQAAATTLYYTPYVHDILVLWDGTRWVTFQVPEFAIALGTLVTGAGYDVFAFTSTATPSSTNTSTEVVTFSGATGWTTGAIVTPASTLNGLTYGTTYFYNAASSTTGSFHTTLADALAGTNKVNLTGNITQALTAVSLELNAWKNATATMTIASPCVVTSNSHGLNAVNWYDPITFTTTGALPTGITANQIYYAVSVTANTFQLYTEPGAGTVNTSGSQSGTHTVWQSRARQTDITLQDGKYCKSGDKTRLHLGSFRASSTTQTLSTGQYRYLWNRYNQVDLDINYAYVAAHTYNGSYRFFNNNFGSASVHIFTGEIQTIPLSVSGEGNTPAAGSGYSICALSLNQPATPDIAYTYLYTPTAYAISYALGATGVIPLLTVGSQVICLTQSNGNGGNAAGFVAVGAHGTMRG